MKGEENNLKTAKIDKYTKEILAELKETQQTVVINPSQDFYINSMVYTFVHNDIYYLVNSDKKIVKYDDFEDMGIKLRNGNIPAMCNLRAVTAVDFIKGIRKVSLYQCFDKINTHMKKYIVFEDDRIFPILALWVIGTYFYKIFRYYPYIWLNADKGSGKSRVMEVIVPLAFNAVMAVNHSEASVFRLVDVDGATLLIDEFEKLKKDNQQGIMTLLNSGFNAEATVIRNERRGDSFKPVAFSSYSPKMFAGIDDISDVLMDRCIRIKMFKKPKGIEVQRYKIDNETDKFLKDLRDDLYICGLQYANPIKETYDSNIIELPFELSDREKDIWEVLYSLAQFIDNESNTNLEEEIKQFSIESSKERSKANIEKNDSYKLISILIDIIPTLQPVKIDGNTMFYDSDKVFNKFKGTEEFSWLKSKNYLTTMLNNKFHISCERATINGKKTRMYCISNNQLKELVDRYNLNEVIDLANIS
ncbi:hypothetical protein LPY66_04170 [Dehalobacter sp. DCM]|uniref:hypothetical protein n=1 Tax=Dehalobacter sp. DCM TaxID=2907827 RepID=UPI0030814F09|nr:hypothetical protein LPY66_04170 [Dehalobacter sp. DCM]